jgi:hypothetical protein
MPRNRNAPIHERLAVMIGHFIGLKPSYLDPLIYISKWTLFHKMASKLLSTMLAAFGGQRRPYTSKNGDLYSSIVSMLHIVELHTYFTTYVH